MARYAWAIDEGDANAWAACFTEDGTFAPSGGASHGQAVYSGHAEIRAVAEQIASELRESNTVTRHWICNIELSPGESADQVTARSYAILVVPKAIVPSHPPTTAAADIRYSVRYYDVIVRTPQGWRLASRRAVDDVPPVGG